MCRRDECAAVSMLPIVPIFVRNLTGGRGYSFNHVFDILPLNPIYGARGRPCRANLHDLP